jgi:hypothetical protein
VEAVRLTLVGNELEAETLCGLLRAHGIACSFRRTDFAAAAAAGAGGFTMAGPTEVLVPAPELDAARRLLPPA